MTVDDQENVYVAWIDTDESLRYAYSKDQGKTWSSHVAVAAPEVINIRYVCIKSKADEPGTIALSYYGSRDGAEYNGYVAETKNGFDATPSFWTVTVNDPDQPLFPWGFESGYVGIVPLIHEFDLNEIVQVKYAPNGDLWVSFVKDMCEGAGPYRPTWDLDAHAGSAFQAVVGRIIHNEATHWEPAKTAVYPPPFDCNQNDVSDVGACLAIGDEEDICPNIINCMCDNCACEILECDRDPYCKSVRQCAVDTYCRGMECLIGCSEEIFTAGELMSVMAIQVAYCSEDSGCSRFCREPLLDR